MGLGSENEVRNCDGGQIIKSLEGQAKDCECNIMG